MAGWSNQKKRYQNTLPYAVQQGGKWSRILGLDTRYVCKKVYEAPTQTFMKRIHPKLRFSRNYDAIRPHSDYCEETIELA